MSNINKQALREEANAANIASWGRWESYKPHKGARGYEVKVGVKAIAQHCLKVDSVFIAAANPATVLSLLDELEAANKAAESGIEWMKRCLAAEKRIAELETRGLEAAGIITKVGE
ncbi:ead/Ea22-like family protein [Enterobacter rongchengensis]|uniref:ead/Ea22-like family protein n=1 Tax=Enterobacter rongchengensis TaxID=3030999 RepID=UPI003B272D94